MSLRKRFSLARHRTKLLEMNISEKQSVLLVIDVQSGFVNQNSSPVLEPLKELIEKWRAASGNIVFTRFVNHPESQWEKLIGWSELMSAPSIDIHQEIAPMIFQGEVFDKHSYSSLTPEVCEFLEASEAREVVITGISTESCVLATALDAFEKGYIPKVISDCCSSQAGEKIHLNALEIISRNIGSEQIVDSYAELDLS